MSLSRKGEDIMEYRGMPKKQGLYDPQFEHDACGIGFISNIKGATSHDIINQAITILKNLAHRGGVGSEEDTGDGAGILIQMPHTFMKKVCKNEGINLPKKGDYGVGMLFLSPDEETRNDSLSKLKNIIAEEKQELLGVRDVPVYEKCIGNTAREAMPYIVQIFVGKGGDMDADEFERKLYIISKRAEREIRYAENSEDRYFYFSSFSSRTLVYKGMLTPDQVSEFYLDLKDVDMKTAIALVHSRFSTNTFPSWERAHPNRYLIHNGEINTIRGNVNWIKARQRMFSTPAFEGEMEKIYPVINEDGSDSAMLDNYLQFLTLSGFSLPHAVMMTVPEPWENNETMDPDRRAFYEYHSCVMEPWDGPAAIAFTDGRYVGATLDRNGLRPARYTITKDGNVILSSEAGVLDVAPENVLKKERLHPGKMLLIDTEKGRIITDEEIKKAEAERRPYKEWVKKNLRELDSLPQETSKTGDTWHNLVEKIKSDNATLNYGDLLFKRIIELENMFVNRENDMNSDLLFITKAKAFGYTWEDLNMTIRQTIEKADDPIHAMGADIPLAVLSEKPQLLYNYFKQLFAQVTNPPIDAIREKVVTSTNTLFGCDRNLLEPSELNCRKIRSTTPILTNEELEKLRNIDLEGFKSITIPILFNINQKSDMAQAMDTVFQAADIAIENGYNIIILSDKGVSKDKAPIPALLVSSGLHHHLIRKGTRMRISIVLESGEPREVHHFCTLIGYGVNGINPYMAYESIQQLIDSGVVGDITYEEAVKNYQSAETKGIVKVMAKMGISTIQSYQGAQIFEALGISSPVVDKYFTGTTTRIGGIGLKHIEKEVMMRHAEAFDAVTGEKALKTGGEYKWRALGEYHMFNPASIYKLQKACRTGDYKLFKEYAAEMNTHQSHQCNIRGMLDIKTIDKPIAIEHVESVDSIVKRFKTGAMSYGSISQEAHECLAIAMNRLGGKSNSGEGGENPERYIPDENGDSRSSAIKQVASGRFGVHIHYLQNAKEIQIKMAQGAKPGEGGHLPGGKVYPWIAKARHSTPGVSLISPPPHHDIYSIEDLAQLIHDLKNANRDARISVKLVSEAGVGTIAVGVAKGRADVILISGFDGGTGAAPKTGIRHAGLPWELGVAETHQALLMNNLRNRVVIETDGKLLTGRDIAVAALLGAEEFGFATGPLITIGCVMMRVCNLDTCPVGVATQNPILRKRFEGKPEYVENFMRFMAQDLREWMAKIGVKTVDEMIGHVEFLQQRSHIDNWKANEVDLTSLLYQPKICSNDYERYHNVMQDHELDKTLDMNTLVKLCAPAIESGKRVEAKLEISNTDRVTGTILSSEITRAHGAEGLPEDTIKLHFVGSAGQSFGAFLAHGVTMRLEGDSNDYIGKGLSGGRIIVVPPEKADFDAKENVIIGNVAFYGAVFGEAYIRGIAGERFCVRNSGMKAVVEGIGDHGCEYMTGGRVAVLGATGRNFAAGMSGGVAYVYDPDDKLDANCNKGLVLIEDMEREADIAELKEMLEKHLEYTGSDIAEKILADFDNEIKSFVRVIPRDYKKVITVLEEEAKKGTDIDEAQLIAFEDVTGKKVTAIA